VSIMRERAHDIGAGLAIDSRLGQGTEIKVDWHNPKGVTLDD
jgi:nitrate/nitrite-specific signal transduction histidine kinase